MTNYYEEDIPQLSATDIFNFSPLPQTSMIEPATPKITFSDEQLEAVNNIHGPMLIIAGAGAGKTRVLMGRIDNMISQGINPQSILAITFTNKAATEMKSRLSIQAQSVTASTIHSFCANLLRKYGQLLGFQPGFTIYDTSDQEQLLSAVKNDVSEAECARYLEINPQANQTYLDNIKENISSITERSLRSKISKAKSNGIGPDQYVVKMNMVDDTPDMTALIYRAYEEMKFADNAMDFDDLLIYTHILLRDHPQVRDAVRNVYKYIMVDEYQDTNRIQNDIINLIVSDTQDLCIVGDPDQSIYKFRGAKIENILEFNKNYPFAKVVELETNYRSTQDVLNVANDIINNNQRLEGKDRILVANSTESPWGKPVVLNADNGFEEASYIANEIKEYVKNGGHYKDIAILYRQNAASRIYDTTFRNNNIPFKIHGGISFYQRKEIKDLIAYLTVLANPSASIAIKRVINVPKRGIGATSQKQIELIAAGKAPLENGQRFIPATSMVTVMMHHLDQVPGLNKTQKAGIQSFLNVFTSIDIMSTTITVKQLLEHILNTTNYIEHLMNSKDENAEDRVNNAKEFLSDAVVFDEDVVKQHPDPLPLVTRVQMFLQKIMLLTSTDKENDNNDDYVTLMTLHSSKGLEFPFVCIVQCAQGYMPSDLAIKDNDIPEERRLMYVGVTRAESRLILSYADEYIQYGSHRNVDESQFIKEIKPEHIERKDVTTNKFDNPFATWSKSNTSSPWGGNTFTW